MKKVLIVGGRGKIGKEINSYLNDRFDILSIGYRDNIYKDKKYFSLDLLDSSTVKNFCENNKIFNTIIFLVGRAHKSGRERDFSIYENTNLITLKNLLNCMKDLNKLPKKIIFASTISVYGEKLGKHIYTESDATTPYSPYAITKLAAERYLLKNFKLRVWILRLAPVYYDGFNLNIDSRTKFGPIYFRVGKGSKVLSLLNIKNIRETINQIIESKIPNGIYNLSDEINYTYNDLLNYQKAKTVFVIPSLIIAFIYEVAKFFRWKKLKENSIKLLSDNIFCGRKIREYIDYKHSLNLNKK